MQICSVLFAIHVEFFRMLLYTRKNVPQTIFRVQSSPDVIQFELESYNSDGRRGNIQQYTEFFYLYTGKLERQVEREQFYSLLQCLSHVSLKNPYKIEVRLIFSFFLIPWKFLVIRENAAQIVSQLKKLWKFL